MDKQSITKLVRKRLTNNIFLLFALIVISTQVVLSQAVEVTDNSGLFYFDAVLFKSDTAGKSRLDIFVLVPYASMSFIKSAQLYGAEYDIYIKIKDENDRIIENKTINRQIIEKDYFVSQGGNGDFDVTQTIFNILPGNYEIEVIYFDKHGHRSFLRTRKQTVIDFSRYSFSLSGILLVNSIEEQNGNYIITPHISDNVGNLSKYFFVFFEAYKDMNTPAENLAEVDFIYQLINDDKEIEFQSKRIRKPVPDTQNEIYLKISLPTTLAQGSYMFRLFAVKSSDEEGFEKYDIIATTERSINNMKSISGNFIKNINQSISQLRYIATQSEMDYLLAPDKEQEKILRFVEFWRKRDPTPHTERNEAYDEYFSRIEYANKNYKSYSEGWLTDMGMAYIIYGEPQTINRGRMNNGNNYEIWSYGEKEIIFIDYNGFGDFRLYSPLSINDKYEYH